LPPARCTQRNSCYGFVGFGALTLLTQTQASGPSSSHVVEGVAMILKRSIETIVEEYFERAEKDQKLTAIL
jgi:hypothetical protein